MNTNETIGIIAATLIISGFIAFVWIGVKNDFRKGGDFTMNNPPGPPKEKKQIEDMTYDELRAEFKRCRERTIQLHEKIREIDMSAGAWFVNGSCK